MMKTPLFDHHLALNATMITFAGFELPLHYGDPLLEWQSCRADAALFDVSHMGVIEIRGKGADLFLEEMSVRSWKRKGRGSVIYTLLGLPEGGVQDDLLAYYFSPEQVMVVANSARRESDLAYLKAFGGDRFEIRLRKEMMILALQGPRAKEYYPKLHDMKKMTFIEDEGILVSRTGYTGEEGIECIGEAKKIISLFDAWRKKGAYPAGLNARDILRLEMGYALYGHELREDIAPLSSIAAWTVEKRKSYPGSDVKKETQSAYGLVMDSPSMIAREGAPLFLQKENIGIVTSGGFSPFLKKPIALVLSKITLPMGKEIEVEVRGKRAAAKIVNPPFFSEEEKKRWLENIASPTSGLKSKG
jgi:aminomethyltransferase